MRDTVRISTNEVEYREGVCVGREREREKERKRESGREEGREEGGEGSGSVRAERLHFPRLDPLHGARASSRFPRLGTHALAGIHGS